MMLTRDVDRSIGEEEEEEEVICSCRGVDEPAVEDMSVQNSFAC